MVLSCIALGVLAPGCAGLRGGGAARHTFNIDFGPSRDAESKQTGPAAAGNPGDFWNTVAIGFNSDHTESDLRFANGAPSPIQVRLVNLGGSWGNSGGMGVKDPMLDSYNYPVNNQGGNSRVILRNVPPGTYDVYVYGHSTHPIYYGDYALTAGARFLGRKQTSNRMDAVENTTWVENSQYVKFPAAKVAAGEPLEILIRPGGRVTDNLGRTFADAMICGLQLVPARR
jgi:hypothetical protein